MSAEIAYYLPKKMLKVSLPLIIVEKKTIYASGATEIEPVDAYIKGDLDITSILIPDLARGKVIYTPGGFGFLKKNTLAVEFDGEGAGILISFNSQDTSAVATVISSTIDLASSLAKVAAAAAATETLRGITQPAPEIFYTERQLEIVQLIDPVREGEIAIDMPSLPRVPKATLKFHEFKGAEYHDARPVSLSKEDKTKIWYLVARPLGVVLTIENNSYIAAQNVTAEILYFPQFGELSSKEIVSKWWWFLGSLNTALNFSASTGSLQKACISSEGNTNDLLADAKKAADSRNSWLTDQKKNAAAPKPPPSPGSKPGN